MKRPIGVTLLAIGAGLAGLFQVYKMLIFMGIVSFNYGLGQDVSFPNPQWGQALWSLILAAIWFWVAAGFWNVRAYAWSFGIFISIFTMIFAFFSIIGGVVTTEFETTAFILSILIFFYLNYPGVRNHFVEHEMSMLTPEQRAAMEQVEKANAAAAAAMAQPAPQQTPPPASPPPASPPPAPPAAPPAG
jgi:hypothetical protein